METPEWVSGTCGVAADGRERRRDPTRSRAAAGRDSAEYSQLSMAVDCADALLLFAVWSRRNRVFIPGEFEARGGGRYRGNGRVQEGKNVVLDRVCGWSCL